MDLKISGYAVEFAGCMWTVAVSRKKKLRIQKYPDTCGRGLSQAVVFSLIHLLSFRACKGKTAMDLVTTVEMKELLTSPVIKETKPVTNGTINQQALDSGIHSDALHQR